VAPDNATLTAIMHRRRRLASAKIGFELAGKQQLKQLTELN